MSTATQAAEPGHATSMPTIAAYSTSRSPPCRSIIRCSTRHSMGTTTNRRRTHGWLRLSGSVWNNSPTCGNSMSTSMCRAMGIRSSSIATPTTPILIRGATSTINEKSPAAYAQLNYDFDIGSVNVGGVLGMRWVKTKDHISGTLFSDQPDPLPTLIEPISVANNYTDWLPNANMNIRFSPAVDSCAWR